MGEAETYSWIWFERDGGILVFFIPYNHLTCYEIYHNVDSTDCKIQQQNQPTNGWVSHAIKNTVLLLS